MSKLRRVIAVALFGLVLSILTVAVLAPSASADPNCRPGQNSNPQPGFKPGGCK